MDDKKDLNVVVYGKSDTGVRRKNNQDNFCVYAEEELFAVADGVGGGSHGEVASRIAIDVIGRRMGVRSPVRPPGRSAVQADSLTGSTVTYGRENSEYTNKLCAAVESANREIYEASLKNPAYKGMATTISAVILRNGRLSIAHVGDSRVYLIRSRVLEQLTDDHSLVSEQVRRGLITQEEADMSNMRNVITRSLGFGPEVKIDISEMNINDGDALLLCSDGLTTMVPESAILNTVLSTNKPEDACTRLINFANKKGGKDNITVIVAYIYKKKRFSFIYKFFTWIRR
jgi:protein phosphatase